MKLSVRLHTLHSYYHGAESIWDIGCDHGQLGLSFYEEALVKRIHLVDPSSDVINNLYNTVNAYIPKGRILVKVCKVRGQEVILDSGKKIIFIAGMGGKEIKEILSHLLSQLTDEDRIIISPHRKILELRKYLSESAYRLIDEQVILEDEQYYQILNLSVSHKLKKVSLYGEELWTKANGPTYLTHQKEHFLKHKDPVSRAYFAYLAAL